MSKLSKVILCTLLILLSVKSKAARPVIKFGEVVLKDFEPSTYPIDSTAYAVVLANFGQAYYEGDTKGGFSIIYKKHLRIRLLNRNAFDAATIHIPLYLGISGLEEKIEKLEAYTFINNNGKVEKTKLENSSVFQDRVDKKHLVKKFTMPNLQEGCIVDIRYTVNSPYERSLEGWMFQGEYPVLWSEYEISVPEVYDYATIYQGYEPFVINTSKLSTNRFTIVSAGGTGRNEVFPYTATVVTRTWAMENVPALKPENFTTALKNHLSRISFQLSKIRYPEQPVKDVMNTWTGAAAEFLKSPDFGEELASTPGWLKTEVKTITAGITNQTLAAKAIYSFVRDNFVCTQHAGVYKANTLKKIFQSKSGTLPELNLLLTAMLSAQGLEAHPVIASTRENGFMSEVYPIEEQMNYVISRVVADGVAYNLDASYTKLGFGHLPPNCYNGTARIIDKLPYLINLSADSLKEEKFTSIFLFKTGNGNLEGNISSNLGKQESYELREKLTTTDSATFVKEMVRAYPSEIKIKNTAINNLKAFDERVVVNSDLAMTFDEDLVYFNPLMAEATKENLFKAATRKYPVEMPYVMNETIVMRMEIPDGYEIEEIPKSTRVKFNEDEGMFEYLISREGGLVQMRTVIRLNKANFLPEDYESLREFFGFIVKKHSEQIVFKKVKA